MAFINDLILDAAAQYIETNTENLYITSQEVITLLEATTTYKLGTKATPTFTGPLDGTTGRKITVDAITDGVVNATGTATHWALTDNTGTALLVTGALSASQAVTSGNTFTLTAFDITFPDPA